MREKQAEWQRNIAYDDIVEATGISKTTLVRMAKERNQRVDLYCVQDETRRLQARKHVDFTLVSV
jgi:hypothetical protein